MSKIYEALQRAEQERLAAASKPPATPPPGSFPAVEQTYAAAPPPPPVWSEPAPAAPAPPAPAPVSAPFPAYSAPASTASADQPPPMLGIGQPLDLSRVAVSLWTPLLEKLPALGERGTAVEQFRSLRTRLFGFRDLNKLKSIMISSGLPREGKSFIAANLAISFARHKSARVLLIDGDMRRSSLHNLFGTHRTPGLATYLAGNAGIVDIMQRPRLDHGVSPLLQGLTSLTFIGGGEEGDKAADLAGSKRFHQLIDSVSPYFDWIIVDSSPVNLVTDGVNLASACDAVLMVARGGVTKFEAAQRALAELKSSKILGVVLNAVEESAATDSYYGYAHYDSLDKEPSPPEARIEPQNASSMAPPPPIPPPLSPSAPPPLP